jgi:hypothetical protein
MNKHASYTKPQLRERIKSRVMAGSDGGKPGQWSARKAQLVAQKYEASGGGYSGKKTEAQKSLSKWTDQKWTTSDGKPAERKGGTTRYLPEKAWGKLSPSERAATNAKKREGSREGEQFVKNTEAAAEARKEAAMKKEASFGYLADMGLLGLPSAAGYAIGRLQPMTDALAKKEIERNYNIFGGLVIPGYTGYHFGTRHAAAARLRDREDEARLRALEEEIQAAEMASKKEASDSGAWQRSEGKNPAKYTFKTAAVPRSIKDERRAQQMIFEGDYAHHGVRREDQLNALLKSREIRPGRISLYSPIDSDGSVINESYSGYPRPARAYMDRDIPGVAFKAQEALNAPPRPLSRGPNPGRADSQGGINREIYETGKVPPRLILNPQKNRSDDPSHWLLTPNKIPLPPKSVLISQPEVAAANAAELRAGRFRHIPSDVYYNQENALMGVPRLGASALPPESHVFPPVPRRAKPAATPPGNFPSRLKPAR